MRERAQSLTSLDALQPVLIGLSFAMAGVIALSARFSFMTTVSPVPVTLQVAAVLLAGLTLGPLWGTLSVVLYLAAGFMGAPVFAMGVGGPSVILQPSFGYLLAFPPAAWVVGTIAAKSRRSVFCGLSACAAGIAVIYLLGASWLAGWFALSGSSLSQAVHSAWTAGVVPFIAVDSLKAILAIGIWTAASPLRRAWRSETSLTA